MSGKLAIALFALALVGTSILPVHAKDKRACKEPCTTVQTSKSNTYRMGGGGGKGAAGRATTAKSSKSNSSDRMGGGKLRAPEPLTPGGY